VEGIIYHWSFDISHLSFEEGSVSLVLAGGLCSKELQATLFDPRV